MSNEELANAFRNLAEILTTHEGKIWFDKQDTMSARRIRLATDRGGSERWIPETSLSLANADIASMELIKLIEQYDQICGS